MITVEAKNKLDNLASLEVSSDNEANVKDHVVSEFLRIFNIFQHAKLESQQNNDRPDYIIKLTSENNPIIVIEVKSPKENLMNHIEQIKRYSYNFNPYLSILTNGVEFLFFSPFWKRECFEKRLVLSFQLQDLKNQEIIEKLSSLLTFQTGSEFSQNLVKFEYEVEKNELKVQKIKEQLDNLYKSVKSIVEKDPDIEELVKFYKKLDSSVQKEVQIYLDKKKQIEQLKNELEAIQTLKIGNLQVSINKSVLFSNIIIPQKQKAENRPGINKGDFITGYSDEIVNVNALIEGKQIVLCKSYQLSNNRIFLLHKSSFQSKFTCSSFAEAFYYSPKQLNTCNYIAEVVFLPIPGKNESFWNEMFENKEFNLWDIKSGPMKYFEGKKGNRSMYFWLLRVYKLTKESGESIALLKDKDYKSGTMGNFRLINEVKQKEILYGFLNNEFLAVLSDLEFTNRATQIMATIKKY